MFEAFFLREIIETFGRIHKLETSALGGKQKGCNNSKV